MTAASVNREQGAGGRELQHLRRPPAHARYVRLSADASANLRLNTTCHGCQAEAVLSMAATSRATWSCAAGLDVRNGRFIDIRTSIVATTFKR